MSSTFFFCRWSTTRTKAFCFTHLWSHEVHKDRSVRHHSKDDKLQFQRARLSIFLDTSLYHKIQFLQNTHNTRCHPWGDRFITGISIEWQPFEYGGIQYGTLPLEISPVSFDILELFQVHQNTNLRQYQISRHVNCHSGQWIDLYYG